MYRILGVLFFVNLAFAKQDHNAATTTARQPADQNISYTAYALKLNQKLKATPRVEGLVAAMNEITQIAEKEIPELKTTLIEGQTPEAFEKNIIENFKRDEAAAKLAKALEKDGRFGKIIVDQSDDKEKAPLLLVSFEGTHYVLAVSGNPARLSLAKNIESSKKGPTPTLLTEDHELGKLMPGLVLPDGTKTDSIKTMNMATQLRWNWGEDRYRVYYSSIRRNFGMLENGMQMFFKMDAKLPIPAEEQEALKKEIDWHLPRKK